MEVVDLAAGSRPGDAARSPCCVGAIDLRVAWQLQAAGSWTGLEASPSARMDDVSSDGRAMKNQGVGSAKVFFDMESMLY